MTKFAKNPFSFLSPGAPPQVRTIQVVSTLPQNPDEETALQTIIAPATIQIAQPPLALEVFKASFAFLIASVTTLPLAVLIMRFTVIQTTSLSLEQKILRPLIPYLGLFVFRLWLDWNSAQRLNGLPDQPILAQGRNDTTRVVIALIGNTSNFTLAMLAAFVILANRPAPIMWGGALILGSLNYTKEFYGELIFAFRKHVEGKQRLGQHIKPFFDQDFIQKLVYCSPYFGAVIREAYPIVSGIIRALVTTQEAARLLTPIASNQTITGVTVPLGILTYWGTAFASQFELIQMGENIRAVGKPYRTENVLSRISIPSVKLIGHTTHGKILFKLLNQCLPTPISMYITLSFFTLGLAAFLQKGLHSYISSTNTALVATGEEGVLMNYILGLDQAQRIAPKIEIGISCVAVTLSVIGTFARIPTIKTHLNREAAFHEHPIEVIVPVENDDRGEQNIQFH